MFTGLVEEQGTVRSVEAVPGGRRFRIGATRVLEETEPGASIAVDGCCLTVTDRGPDSFGVAAVPETLACTTLGERVAGDRVNLERALRLDQRLGGHLVQGHVDGVGEVAEVRPEGEGRRLVIEVPAALARFVAAKGSLSVDGISLTVAASCATRCEIALIPHTLSATGAGRWAPGRRVNLEVDLLARYLARLLEGAEEARGTG